ncbi:MAG: T9SS type A sorting domain-containing protein [Bacteroidetes bacterium]|nr:T9SS type A sorting domain-containing protein [Bacteroidota bacterium]MCA6442093.1 T9SS type A sorting domain-containing protein [Bacteroidota bacterium]
MKTKLFLALGTLAITSGFLNAQTTNPAPYCVAAPGNFLADEITNVKLNNLNNSSTVFFAGSRYVFYNSVTVPTLAINSVVNMSVSVRRHDCMPDFLGAYIDINGDNTFTATEYLGFVPPVTLFTAPCGGGGGAFPIVTFTFNLTIPNTALPGVTRMRVIYGNSMNTPVAAASCFTAPANPSSPFYAGEVEDYNVNLVTGAAATPPVANFTVPVNVCKNQTITLNDNSTNTPTAWSWTLTGASPATSTLQNPAITYTNAGTYTISLVSSNASGASAIVSKTIAIIDCSPVANFTVPANVCKNQTITLNDNSTNTPTAWSWTLTGASPATSMLQNPVITYTNAGTYTISLKSTNSGGASAIVSKTISINVCNVGVNELENDEAKNITIYPNPTNGAFAIDLKSAGQVSIYNLLGEQIFIKQLQAGKHSLDITHQATGVYFVRVKTENTQQQVKIIKE